MSRRDADAGCSVGSEEVFFFKGFYLFTRDTEREREAETQAEGEAGSNMEPNVGLDPGTPES